MLGGLAVSEVLPPRGPKRLTQCAPTLVPAPHLCVHLPSLPSVYLQVGYHLTPMFRHVNTDDTACVRNPLFSPTSGHPHSGVAQNRPKVL